VQRLATMARELDQLVDARSLEHAAILVTHEDEP
jgi:hypothetical protein